MNVRLRSCAWLLCLLALPCGAWADGVMMPKIEELGAATKMVASPKQEAVIATDGQTVEVILRTHFRRGPAELAWVVPVPAKPEKVEPCDDEVFTVLERETAPRFLRFSGSDWPGLHCGCGAAYVGDQMAPSVVVEQQGTAGIFKYVVLSATDPRELTRWLDEHKYHVPIGAERIFRRYVAEGWHWLAMRVRPEAMDQPTLAPHPIRYAYRDTKLVYPLEISQLSADLENEIVLYVVGAGRYACGNWANHTIDPNALRARAGATSGTNYEELVRSATAERDGHLFVTELSQSWSLFGYAKGRSSEINDALSRGLLDALDNGQHITRLRAVMTPKAMDRDVLLVRVSGWGNVRSTFHLAAAPAAGPATARLAVPLLPLALLGAAAGLLRRQGWTRRAAIIPAALACLSLAML